MSTRLPANTFGNAPNPEPVTSRPEVFGTGFSLPKNSNVTQIRIDELKEDPGRTEGLTVGDLATKKIEVLRGGARPPPYCSWKDWDEKTMRWSDQMEWENQKKRQALGNSTYYDLDDQKEDIPNLSLELLDIEKEVLDDFTVTIIGRRRSGKSWIARWLLYNLKHRFPCAVVVTATAINNFWSKHIPKEFIHDVENVNEVLGVVLERQKALLQHPELEIDPRILVVLDDVLKDAMLIRFSKHLRTMYTDGRHLKVFLVVIIQDPTGIPPTLRENTDLAIIFRVFQKGRKEAVADNYLDYIADKKTQMQFLWNQTQMLDPKTMLPMEQEQATEEELNHGIPEALCVVQGKQTENLKNIFKTLIAEEPPDFAIGDENYWKAMKNGRWKSVAHTYKFVQNSQVCK
jgi:hypothetical protein